MNNLLWAVQILLAGVFLFTSAGKLFDYEQLVRVIEGRSRGKLIGMSRFQPFWWDWLSWSERSGC